MDSHCGYTLPISLTANQRTNFSLQIDADSDFIIEKVYSNETGPFKLMIIDTTSNYQWFSDRVRMENFFGSAQYPNELPVPIGLRRSTQLQIDIQDLTGAPNEIELVFEGLRQIAPIAPVTRRYYGYVKDFSVAPLDNIQDTLITSADADFSIERFIAYTDQDYQTKLKMSLSSLVARQIYSQFTFLENVFGSVLRPNNLRHPLPMPKNSIAKFEIKNLDNNPHTLQLLLDGVKVWS